MTAREVEGRARDAALRLLAWMEERDWRGHDPFDLLLSPWAAPIRPFRWPSVAWIQMGKRARWPVRSILDVPTHENPKALALGILGCLSLADAGHGPASGTARRLVARLHAAQQPGGGWGYPFPWANRHFRVPAGTPSGVVTAFATQALLAASDRGITPEGAAPDAVGRSVVAAATFVHEGLALIPSRGGPLLSYTPLDRRGVHNASLLAAVVLARGSAAPGGDPAWADVARTVARTTLGAQRPDGSWPYGTSRRDAFEDAYHTGYVLSALTELDVRVGVEGAGSAVARGYVRFRDAFLGGPAVGPAPGVPTPVDLHAVAQAILTLLEFAPPGDDGSSARSEAHRLAGWALDHAARPDGAFAYTWSPGRVNAIPYLRWVQAWMFRALAALAAT